MWSHDSRSWDFQKKKCCENSNKIPRVGNNDRNNTITNRWFRDRPQSSVFGAWLEFSQLIYSIQLWRRGSCGVWIRIQKSSEFWSVQTWGFDSVPSVTGCGEEEWREIFDVIHKCKFFLLLLTIVLFPGWNQLSDALYQSAPMIPNPPSSIWDYKAFRASQCTGYH